MSRKATSSTSSLRPVPGHDVADQQAACHPDDHRDRQRGQLRDIGVQEQREEVRDERDHAQRRGERPLPAFRSFTAIEEIIASTTPSNVMVIG